MSRSATFDPSAVIPRPAAPDAALGTGPELSPDASGYDYDPGFRQAVADGYLTVEQAIQRGDRQAYAVHLANRYRLSLDVGFDIADNRTRLRDAVRRRDDLERAAARLEPTPPVSRIQKRAVLIPATVILAVVALHGWATWQGFVDRSRQMAVVAVDYQTKIREKARASVSPARAAPGPAGLSSTEVRKDVFGQLTEVVGPDPSSVLVGYCRSRSLGSQLEPVELSRDLAGFPGLRLGVYRDRFRPGQLFAIRIRRDPGTGRWIAGTGQSPITEIDAGSLPLDRARVGLSGY